MITGDAKLTDGNGSAAYNATSVLGGLLSDGLVQQRLHPPERYGVPAAGEVVSGPFIPPPASFIRREKLFEAEPWYQRVFSPIHSTELCESDASNGGWRHQSFPVHPAAVQRPWHATCFNYASSLLDGKHREGMVDGHAATNHNSQRSPRSATYGGQDCTL